MRAQLDALAIPQTYPAYQSNQSNQSIQPRRQSTAASAPHEDRNDETSQQQNWQAKLVADYTRTVVGQTRRMRQRLAQQILALTGYGIDERMIAVDIGARRASMVVDGVMFLLREESLRIVRTCVWCGTGQFESDPITSRSGLGYALAGWQPSHGECASVDPPDDVSW